MVEVVVLGSGSRGNATLVRTARSALLIDAGLSCRQLCARLEAVGHDPRALDAVLVTHEHVDHVQGLPVLLRRRPMPVFLNAETAAAAHRAVSDASSLEIFETGRAFDAGGFRVTAFPIPHDAVAPVGFVLEAEGVRVGFATDLGHVTTEIKARLAGCHAIVLEANHDPQMLIAGPYPWATKQRVASRFGHLSNDGAAEALAEIASENTQAVVLAHISETNNVPGLAAAAAGAALRQAGRAPSLACAAQHRPAAALRL